VSFYWSTVTVRVCSVYRSRVRVMVRVSVRFRFSDRVGIGFTDVE